MRRYLADVARTHTGIPLEIQSDGTGLVRFQPNSFVLIEIGK